MIFQHTWQKVLSGEKTQTRRLITMHSSEWSHDENGNRVQINEEPFCYYKIGKTYAVQTARLTKAIAHIRITDIRREDVREIYTEDVEAEGFQYRLEFFKVWTQMHDPIAYKFLEAVNDPLRIDDHLSDRPAALYDAWALTFELVTP